MIDPGLRGEKEQIGKREGEREEREKRKGKRKKRKRERFGFVRV